MKTCPTINKELVEAIKHFPGFNLLVFGISTATKPQTYSDRENDSDVACCKYSEVSH
jgi:hypothetical protein